MATLFTVQVSQCFVFVLCHLRNISYLFVCFFIQKRLANAYNSLWKAASFNAYRVFCAEHPGAIEIVKNLQRKRPVEWDAFE
jgi:hypothetical protein